MTTRPSRLTRALQLLNAGFKSLDLFGKRDHAVVQEPSYFRESLDLLRERNERLAESVGDIQQTLEVLAGRCGQLHDASPSSQGGTEKVRRGGDLDFAAAPVTADPSLTVELLTEIRDLIVQVRDLLGKPFDEDDVQGGHVGDASSQTSRHAVQRAAERGTAFGICAGSLPHSVEDCPAHRFLDGDLLKLHVREQRLVKPFHRVSPSSSGRTDEGGAAADGTPVAAPVTGLAAVAEFVRQATKQASK